MIVSFTSTETEVSFFCSWFCDGAVNFVVVCLCLFIRFAELLNSFSCEFHFY
jgi:hypothetical protein